MSIKFVYANATFFVLFIRFLTNGHSKRSSNIVFGLMRTKKKSKWNSWNWNCMIQASTIKFYKSVWNDDLDCLQHLRFALALILFSPFSSFSLFLDFCFSVFFLFLHPHTGKAVPFVELTVAHASVLTILAISFERYYAICEPLKAGYVCTKTRALMICLAAWAVAAIFTR